MILLCLKVYVQKGEGFKWKKILKAIPEAAISKTVI